jgi:hypothetical protein
MMRWHAFWIVKGMKSSPEQWIASQPLSPIDIDCVTTVMLKILDGKCKMSSSGKIVMEALYDLLRDRSGHHLDGRTHQLIEHSRASEMSEELRMQIYERRLLAETMISRPVMKAFKARLRADGVIGSGIAV